jgi:hypothetical protein
MLPSSCACGDASDAGALGGDNLLPYIDLANVVCLNELRAGSARHAFKSPAGVGAGLGGCGVASPDGDALLVFKIPFTCAVRVRALCVAGGAGGASPAALRLFVNDESIDAGSASEAVAAQELRPPEDLSASIWHGLKPSKFGNVFHLTVAATGALSGERLQIFFLGLRGEATGVRRAVVHAVYESRAQAADHAASSSAAGDGAAARMGGAGGEL